MPDHIINPNERHMQAHEFYQLFANYMAENPNERRGQAAFNLMHDLYPSIADQFRSSNIDPFYDDKKIRPFLQACFEKIKDKV